MQVAAKERIACGLQTHEGVYGARTKAKTQPISVPSGISESPGKEEKISW